MREVFALRVSSEERELLAAAARARGVPPGTFLRAAALEAASQIVHQTDAPEAPAPVAERDPPSRQLPRREDATLQRVLIDGLWVEVELPEGARFVDGELVLP